MVHSEREPTAGASGGLGEAAEKVSPPAQMGFFTSPAMRAASTNAMNQRTAEPAAQRMRRSGSDDRKGAMRAPLRQTAKRRKDSSPWSVRPKSIWAAPGISERATIRIRNGADYSQEA